MFSYSELNLPGSADCAKAGTRCQHFYDVNVASPCLSVVAQKAVEKSGGRGSRIVRPQTEADFSDSAPLVQRSCVGWWGDLWLLMKSQSDLPFPELCVSQLF